MTVPTLDASQRQILVNLGNRYVVFGPSASLPQSLLFDPETDFEILPRVADESEVAEARIRQTLRVAGMKTSTIVDSDSEADVELVDDEGRHIFIDIKVKDGNPKKRDFSHALERVKEAAGIGQTLEIWYFNIERLKLVIVHPDKSRIDELTPLNVWEKTADGVFDQAHVIEEVEDWVHRIKTLYDDVRTWLKDQVGLRFESSRTVTMSEEMMQEFAVTDREIPVLDILDSEQVIASFVPRGLWLIGSWGRIDIITRDRTHVLLALRIDGNLAWQMVSHEDRRRMTPFDKNALLALMNNP